MGNTNKTLPILLIIILSMPLLTMAESATAQSTPKLSVPKFTARFIDNSHDVLPTTTIDPYSGQTLTKEGYLAVNRSIEVAIENPPVSNYGVFYNIRVKGHYEEDWTTLFDGQKYPQSLLITFSSTEEGYYYSWGSQLLYASYGGQVDIQVKAIAGHYSEVIDNQPQLPWSTGYLTAFISESESDWSNTQTLRITDGSVSTSSDPTVSPSSPSSTDPTSTPTSTVASDNSLFGSQQLTDLALVAAVAVLATAFVLLLMYVGKIKKRLPKQ